MVCRRSHIAISTSLSFTLVVSALVPPVLFAFVDCTPWQCWSMCPFGVALISGSYQCMLVRVQNDMPSICPTLDALIMAAFVEYLRLVWMYATCASTNGRWYRLVTYSLVKIDDCVVLWILSLVVASNGIYHSPLGSCHLWMTGLMVVTILTSFLWKKSTPAWPDMNTVVYPAFASWGKLIRLFLNVSNLLLLLASAESCGSKSLIFLMVCSGCTFGIPTTLIDRQPVGLPTTLLVELLFASKSMIPVVVSAWYAELINSWNFGCSPLLPVKVVGLCSPCCLFSCNAIPVGNPATDQLLYSVCVPIASFSGCFYRKKYHLAPCQKNLSGTAYKWILHWILVWFLVDDHHWYSVVWFLHLWSQTFQCCCHYRNLFLILLQFCLSLLALHVSFPLMSLSNYICSLILLCHVVCLLNLWFCCLAQDWFYLSLVDVTKWANFLMCTA